MHVLVKLIIRVPIRSMSSEESTLLRNPSADSLRAFLFPALPHKDIMDDIGICGARKVGVVCVCVGFSCSHAFMLCDSS